MRAPSVVALGGGHGLAVTLNAVTRYAGQVTAVVSVADDGGSSGRLRAFWPGPAPGDVRRCLLSLAADGPLEKLWAQVLDYRFTAGELVGHSLGGSVVSVAAALMRVRGVVNLDQTMDLTSFQASLRALEPLLRADAATFAATMDMIFDAMRGSLSDEEWARLRALRRYDQEVVLDIWASVFELGEDQLAAMVTNLAGAIHAPYLSLHGTDPGENYESWLSALVPQAVVERWAGAGHYPHLAEPERFLARLADFEARL